MSEGDTQGQDTLFVLACPSTISHYWIGSVRISRLPAFSGMLKRRFDLLFSQLHIANISDCTIHHVHHCIPGQNCSISHHQLENMSACAVLGQCKMSRGEELCTRIHLQRKKEGKAKLEKLAHITASLPSTIHPCRPYSDLFLIPFPLHPM